MTEADTGGSHSLAGLHVYVSGRVQRVGFRYMVIREARALNLVGYVRNLADGRVEIQAEGPKPRLDRLLATLERGPTFGYVTQVDVEWGIPTGRYSGFDVVF